MRFLFSDCMLKRRELRRGSEPIEAKPLLRLVRQLGEPDASLGILNLSEVFSFRPLDYLAKCAESRKAGLSDSASGRNCYVTCVTISNGLFLY